ncbi:MAG: AI-2E family transporter [Proteobacteria bacterium]|nr:AI-2E family transporter [Pseudomonadota bacterium]MBI3495819.1 AI-2E family transporter [Pseudomonadota bacterium]
MTWRQRLLVWLAGFAGAVFVVYELRNVLLPFVAGMAIAYLLDPVVDRLERWRLGRTPASVLALVAFLLAALGSLLLIVPVIEAQIVGLLARLPQLIQRGRELLAPVIEAALARLGEEDGRKLPELASGYVGDAARLALGAVVGLLSGGAAVANILSLLFIMPIVSFYLLRDWDHMIGRIDGWLPRANAETIRAQAREIDATLSGFVRGQSLVCLALAGWYAMGLSLAGLDFGVLIGVFVGLLSFIPLVGALVGGVLSVGLGLIQFDRWTDVALVAGVFAVGQVLEGHVLAPRLIGDKVGLHPVWIMFALLAGGALAGFLGVLLAVPAAAVIGVLARFALARYLESPFYREPARPDDGG